MSYDRNFLGSTKALHNPEGDNMEIKATLTKVTMDYWDGLCIIYLHIGTEVVAMAKAETEAEAYEKLQEQTLPIGDLIGWEIPAEITEG